MRLHPVILPVVLAGVLGYQVVAYCSERDRIRERIEKETNTVVLLKEINNTIPVPDRSRLWIKSALVAMLFSTVVVSLVYGSSANLLQYLVAFGVMFVFFHFFQIFYFNKLDNTIKTTIEKISAALASS